MRSMALVLEVVVGVLFAIACVAVARRFGPRVEMRLYATGLIITAIIYVLFAIVGGADRYGTAVEVAGLLPFAGITWLGVRYSARWLAIGWAAHAIWDVGLHLVAGTPPFVPGWYPMMCVGFDFFIAGRILSVVNRLPLDLARSVVVGRPAGPLS